MEHFSPQPGCFALAAKDPGAVYKVRRRALRMTCVAEVPPTTAERWIDEHLTWFAKDRLTRDGPQKEELMEERAASRPHRGLPPHLAMVPLDAAEVVVKAESLPLLRSFRYALSGRPGRAGRAFRLGRALSRAGVRTPRPLALIEHREKGLVRRSFLVLESIEAMTLREVLLARLPAMAPGEEVERFKAAIWEAVAKEVATLHAARYRQRDLKAANILAAEDGCGGFLVHLIDLDGVTRLRTPPANRVRMRDLARLLVSLRAPRLAAAGVTAEDWTRLVSIYIEKASGRSPDTGDVKAFVEQTARWARRKEKRNRRRRRPIS